MKRYAKWWPFLFLAVIGYLVFAIGRGLAPFDAAPDIAYSRFKGLVAQGQVVEVLMEGPSVLGRLARAQTLIPDGEPVDRFTTRVPAVGDPNLLSTLESAGVEVQVRAESESFWKGAVQVAPWLVLVLFFLLVLRQSSGNVPGGMGRGAAVSRFLHRGVSKRVEKVPDMRFADVAGQEHAKREVAELVDFLRSPEKYERMGAEVPHGVLLMGPPGTGKTLLARALAGEAGVPFYSISASEFIELYVGVGAARVRNLFDDAKKNAPSIIFVDELDSIGRVRGSGVGGGHDEREQTLNQILAEMDGFSGREAVIVLAATNRPDVLDPALLRPGRFDRHITVDLPDRRARHEILSVHARKVPLAADVDLGVVANGTPGFSGADLKNLVNEAAMMAAREGTAEVHGRHFFDMRDRVIGGAVRTIAMTDDERHRLAVHEAGHTTVAHFLPNTDPLYKVSIIPRGSSLGGTQQMPEEDRYTLPEDFLRDRLSVILAGRAAEKIVLGSVSSGADDDIRRATKLARAMVARWGMSDDVGPMDVRESDEHPFLGREIAQHRFTSETTAKAVDEAVRRLLTQAESRARKLIRGNRAAFDRLVVELEANETLERPDIEACLEGTLRTLVGRPAVFLEPEDDDEVARAG